MTSSISWIDRDGLVETLRRFGLSTPAPLRATPPRGGVAQLDPIVDTRPRPKAFTPPDGPLRDRLEAFVRWLMRLEGSRVAFIIDRDGLPLVDEGADADLLAIASSVMQLVERMNRKLLAVLGSAVTIQLEEGQLILVSVTTPIGLYTVGRVAGRAQDLAQQEATAEALQAAFRSRDKRPDD